MKFYNGLKGDRSKIQMQKFQIAFPRSYFFVCVTSDFFGKFPKSGTKYKIVKKNSLNFKVERKKN